MNPGKMTLRSLQVVQLRLLPNPKNAERQKAHQVNEKLRSEQDQCMAQIAFAPDQLLRGHMKIEQEQRHRYAEDAVAQRRKPLHALTRDPVVGSAHRRIISETLRFFCHIRELWQESPARSASKVFCRASRRG